MNHVSFYLSKRKERTNEVNKLSLGDHSVFLLLARKIMSGYHTSHENGLNEVRNIINQKSTDELVKLINNDDEIIKLVGNLNEVRYSTRLIIDTSKFLIFFLVRFQLDAADGNCQRKSERKYQTHCTKKSRPRAHSHS
jgi:hypothetical protein